MIIRNMKDKSKTIMACISHVSIQGNLDCKEDKQRKKKKKN